MGMPKEWRTCPSEMYASFWDTHHFLWSKFRKSLLSRLQGWWVPQPILLRGEATAVIIRLVVVRRSSIALHRTVLYNKINLERCVIVYIALRYTAVIFHTYLRYMIELKRDIEKSLERWRVQHGRKPLLVRGARQVGKSYTITTWARRSFERVVVLNLEERPQFRQLFAKDLAADRMLDEINLLTGVNLRLPNSLLFIDEIQTCPAAITGLRYFYENMPGLFVIAAGSLIEFILQEIGFPVGRVESMYMFPLTFYEYMSATGRQALRERLESERWKEPVPDLLHRSLLDDLRAYCRIGGMPKPLATYLETRDYTDASREHATLLQAYTDDFAKYSKRSDWQMLREVFERLPQFVARTRVKYSQLAPGGRCEKIKRELALLEYAHLAEPVTATYAAKLPLHAAAKPNFFKLLFLDIGLLQHALGFDWRSLPLDVDITSLCDGCFAEQFVGQQILAARSLETRYTLHYWDRHAPGADAEVDYVIEHEGNVTPVEVKSGVRGTLKSLARYNKEFQPRSAVVLSQRNVERADNITWVPLYFAGSL